MAILHDLIRLLGDEQLQLITAQTLPVRERQVLDFIIAKKKDKLFPSSLALRKLDLTQTHFEKICSVLMKKIVLLLAGPDPHEQFRFIRSFSNRPPGLIRHQMRISAKQITGRDALIQFYTDCCEIITRFSTTDMDRREITHYSGKLLALIDPHQHPEKYIRIKCDALYATISMIALDLGIDDMHTRSQLIPKIMRLNDEARNLGHPVGRHHALRIASMFFISIGDDDRSMAHIDEDIFVTAEHEAIFSVKEWLEPRLLQAEVLGYAGKIRESYDLFCSLIKDRRSKDNLRLTSQTRFFKAAISLGEYEVAREILENNFAAASTGPNLDVKIMAHLQYICYYQHIGDLQQAATHLAAARMSISRQRQQQYYIQLLFFENAQLYLTAQYEEARLQVQRNIKFLRSKNKNRSNSDYPALFSTISAIYDHHFSGQSFSARQQRDYDGCFQKSYSHFGGIVKRMLDMKGNRGFKKPSASTVSHLH
ncbi:MAG: hypothetical protein JWO03_4049 [Bacteroidetes bacterium]|nr:hypothetical protein [Bacteroidota bacterium]